MLEKFSWALITGASSGIGEAFARHLATMGKNLVLAARSEPKLHALAKELTAECDVQAHAIAMDLSQPAAAVSLFAETERRGLPIDLLVNNAGFARTGHFAELPLDDQIDMVRLNVEALVALTGLYLPAMQLRKSGGIINVASNAAFQPVPNMAVYAASKAFVLHFSEALAEEVSSDGIKVLALCPGATATEFWTRAGVWQDRVDKMAAPEQVVSAGLEAFERRPSSFVPGTLNRVVAFAASHLAPRRLAARIAGRVLQPGS